MREREVSIAIEDAWDLPSVEVMRGLVLVEGGEEGVSELICDFGGSACWEGGASLLVFLPVFGVVSVEL